MSNLLPVRGTIPPHLTTDLAHPSEKKPRLGDSQKSAAHKCRYVRFAGAAGAVPDRVICAVYPTKQPLPMVLSFDRCVTALGGHVNV